MNSTFNRVSLIVVSIFILVTIIKGFPHGQEETKQLRQIPTDNNREQRILGILGNWGYGYPGFGRGAYGGSCRITGYCPWYGSSYGKGYNGYGYGGGYPYYY